MGASGTSSINLARPSGGTAMRRDDRRRARDVEHHGGVGRRARLLPHHVPEALGHDPLQRKIGDRAFEIAGPVEGLAHVLLVVPAVEHADGHELAVRARAFGCEAFAIPVLRCERAQRVEPAVRDRPKLVEQLDAVPVGVRRDPLLVGLADVVLHVRGGTGVGGDTRLLTREHALGADHVRHVVAHRPTRALGREVPLRGSEIAAEVEDVRPHFRETIDHRFAHACAP